MFSLDPKREALPTHARTQRAEDANALTRGGTLSSSRVSLRLPRGRWAAPLIALFLLAATAVPTVAAAPNATPWIGLASGRIGDYLWSVQTTHPAGRAGAGAQGAQRPCLMVGTTWELGPYNYRRSKYKACAGVSGRLTASEPPVIATSVEPVSGASVEMTAVGMMVAPTVRSIQVTRPDGRRQTIHLDRLTAPQAHAARLGRFRYAAFAEHGLWCAERLVTQDAAGRTLWDSGTDGYACGEDGSTTFAP